MLPEWGRSLLLLRRKEPSIRWGILALFMALLGLVVIAAAVYLVVRRVDVRLALIPAGLLMGLLAGDPFAIVRTLFITLVDQKFVIPICFAMGFAYVLRETGCDKHLVRLLANPLRNAKAALIPGAVLVGFLVNIPIISQTSTAVAIGAVLVPLMMAAGVSPVIAGSALLLGASVGGELLNPGAPEYGTVTVAIGELTGQTVSRSAMPAYALPLLLVQLAVSAAVFTIMSWRYEKRQEGAKAEPLEPFRPNLLKAMVPLFPIALLFLTAEPFRLFAPSPDWLVGAKEVAGLSDEAGARKSAELFDSRWIGAAMLLGALIAMATAPKAALGAGKAFFEGMGYAYKEIIGIIVAASCFAEGVKLIGVGELFSQLVGGSPQTLVPASGYVPMLFAALSGSGMASTQGLYALFAEPGIAHGLNLERLGAIVSIGAAAGRTMSPVAAVALMSAKLTGADSPELCKRVALPLVIGLTATLLYALALF